MLFCGPSRTPVPTDNPSPDLVGSSLYTREPFFGRIVIRPYSLVHCRTFSVPSQPYTLAQKRARGTQILTLALYILFFDLLEELADSLESLVDVRK